MHFIFAVENALKFVKFFQHAGLFFDKEEFAVSLDVINEK